MTWQFELILNGKLHLPNLFASNLMQAHKSEGEVSREFILLRMLVVIINTQANRKYIYRYIFAVFVGVIY